LWAEFVDFVCLRNACQQITGSKWKCRSRWNLVLSPKNDINDRVNTHRPHSPHRKKRLLPAISALGYVMRQTWNDQSRQPGHPRNLQNLLQIVNIGACPRKNGLGFPSQHGYISSRLFPLMPLRKEAGRDSELARSAKNGQPNYLFGKAA
jgi:hypothetical protein